MNKSYDHYSKRTVYSYLLKPRYKVPIILNLLIVYNLKLSVNDRRAVRKKRKNNRLYWTYCLGVTIGDHYKSNLTYINIYSNLSDNELKVIKNDF